MFTVLNVKDKVSARLSFTLYAFYGSQTHQGRTSEARPARAVTVHGGGSGSREPGRKRTATAELAPVAAKRSSSASMGDDEQCAACPETAGDVRLQRRANDVLRVCRRDQEAESVLGVSVLRRVCADGVEVYGTVLVHVRTT